ncbi:MAG: Tim44 domain-containing protein [Rhodospirillales bacterium]|nr:Tim44 domain-containing protein [Rhodospirillales bacterium]
MGDGFQFIDLIFFAMVAAFLVLRLRGVLGRRTGTKTGHTDPFKSRPAEPAPVTDAKPARAKAESPLEATLTEIGIADPKFDKKEFLSGARMAFEMILGAFAGGDRAALKPMLSPEVYSNFSQVISDREKAGNKLDQTIVATKAADIADASLDGSTAQITVKFTSEQINALRDSAGTVIEGDAKTPTTVVDFWIFARDTRSRDPNWTLIGTQSLE